MAEIFITRVGRASRLRYGQGSNGKEHLTQVREKHQGSSTEPPFLWFSIIDFAIQDLCGTSLV